MTAYHGNTFSDKKNEKKKTVIVSVKYIFTPHESFTKGLVRYNKAKYSKSP